MQNALVIGCNGTIGKELINLLLNKRNYKTVTALLSKDTRKLKSMHLIKVIVNYDDDKAIKDALKNITHLFICIGSDYASEQLLSEEDQNLNLPYKIALFAKELGILNINLVNPNKANINSSNTYLKQRGELLIRLKELNFACFNVYSINSIKRDSGKDGILIVLLSNLINLLTFGYWHNNRPINANYLATAMIKIALMATPGYHVYLAHKIRRLV